MKGALITTALVMSIYIANAQMLKPEPGKVEFGEIVHLPDSTISKDMLYSQALSWFVTTFKNSDYVLRVKDKENGKLTGKGSQVTYSWNYKNNDPAYINYYIDIDVKQGRYRYKFYSLTITGLPDMTFEEAYTRLNRGEGIPTDLFDSKTKALKRYKTTLSSAIPVFVALANSLKQAMSVTKKDDF